MNQNTSPLNQFWQTLEPTYQDLTQHPFFVELSHGTLKEKQFSFFVQQDSHYLIEFSKALSLIGKRSNSQQINSRFSTLAAGCLVLVNDLRTYYATELEISPVCHSYTQHLISIASSHSFENCVSSVAPCYWIYHKLGLFIKANSNDQNPYAKWIKNTITQEFSMDTDFVISTVNEILANCSKQTFEKMLAIAKESAKHEWKFWNDAYTSTNFKH